MHTLGLAALAVFILAFGLVSKRVQTTIGPALEVATPLVALYVVASLTVVRMVPVALSLLGLRLMPEMVVVSEMPVRLRHEAGQ